MNPKLERDAEHRFKSRHSPASALDWSHHKGGREKRNPTDHLILTPGRLRTTYSAPCNRRLKTGPSGR
nr:MAG TPA: hypothetical protein [Caudoviricetes sp.]